MSRTIQVTSLTLAAALTTGAGLAAAGAIPGQSRAAPRMSYDSRLAMSYDGQKTSSGSRLLMYHDGRKMTYDGRLMTYDGRLMTFDGRIWLVKPAGEGWAALTSIVGDGAPAVPRMFLD